jgi:hypothetical protein
MVDRAAVRFYLSGCPAYISLRRLSSPSLSPWNVHNGVAFLKTINREIVRMERRLHTRHRARTTVYVVMSGRKSRICRAKNLSANGVFVETENLGLRKGQQVQLAFAINLGLVTKIHRRTAIVAHVTRGGTGLMMEQFAGR